MRKALTAALAVVVLAVVLVTAPQPTGVPVFGPEPADAQALGFLDGDNPIAFIDFEPLLPQERVEITVTLTPTVEANYSIEVRSSAGNILASRVARDTSGDPVTETFSLKGSLDPAFTPARVRIRRTTHSFQYEVNAVRFDRNVETGYTWNNAGRTDVGAVEFCGGERLAGNVKFLAEQQFRKVVVGPGESANLTGSVETSGGIMWGRVFYRRLSGSTGTWADWLTNTTAVVDATVMNTSTEPWILLFLVEKVTGISGPEQTYDFELTVTGAPPCGIDRSGLLRSNPLHDDPVNTASGELSNTWGDLAFLQVYGLDWGRSYNSMKIDQDSLLGPGWASTLTQRIEVFDDPVAPRVDLWLTMGTVRILWIFLAGQAGISMLAERWCRSPTGPAKP